MDDQGQRQQQTRGTVSVPLLSRLSEGALSGCTNKSDSLYLPGESVHRSLHIPCVKATFVNGSGAAELSHFRVGAVELRELEGMQAKEMGVVVVVVVVRWGVQVKEWVEKAERQQK